MKFLIDEQLPKLLADGPLEKGYDLVHVSALLTNTKIPDGYICERSMAESRVVITKDSDFFNTYLIKKQPYKLLYITPAIYVIVHYLTYSGRHFPNCSIF